MKAYKMSVEEAQLYRARLEVIEEALAEYEAAKATLSGSAKAAVTRKMRPLEREHDEIQALLKDTAPPPPMSLGEAKVVLQQSAKCFREDYEKAVETFEKRFAVNPVDALGWRSESVVKAVTTWRVFSAFVDVIGDEASTMADITEAFEAALVRASEEFGYRISCISSSSSVAHNMVRIFELETLGHLVSGIRQDWRIRELHRYLDVEVRWNLIEPVEVWEYLQQEDDYQPTSA